MNNKGFTLIELLAVLVILITILTIAIPSITSSVERNKKNMLNKKIEIIETGMELYVDTYKNSFDRNKFYNGYCCINIDKLVEKNILKDSDLYDSDNNKIEGHVCFNYFDKVLEYTSDEVMGEC